MKIIKITNGEVTIKDFCSRKLKKDINKSLFSNIQVKSGEQGNNFEGFSIEDLDKSNDVALIGMVDKITIDGKDKPVTIETFDEMNVSDVDVIIKEINKITNKEIPNV